MLLYDFDTDPLYIANILPHPDDKRRPRNATRLSRPNRETNLCQGTQPTGAVSQQKSIAPLLCLYANYG